MSPHSFGALELCIHTTDRHQPRWRKRRGGWETIKQLSATTIAAELYGETTVPCYQYFCMVRTIHPFFYPYRVTTPAPACFFSSCKARAVKHSLRYFFFCRCSKGSSLECIAATLKRVRNWRASDRSKYQNDDVYYVIQRESLHSRIETMSEVSMVSKFPGMSGLHLYF